MRISSYSKRAFTKNRRLFCQNWIQSKYVKLNQNNVLRRIIFRAKKLRVVNPVTSYKYLRFFQIDKTNQYDKKKKLIELVHTRIHKMIGTNLSSKNMVIALNKVVVSLLNYLLGVFSWTKTELAEVDYIVVAKLK